MAITQVKLLLGKENSQAKISLCLTIAASTNFSIKKTVDSTVDEVLLPKGIKASSEALRGAAISGLFFCLSQLRQGGELPYLTVTINCIKGQLDETDLTIVAEIASIALAYAIDVGHTNSIISVDNWKLLDVQRLVMA